MTKHETVDLRYCGRHFTAEEIELIRALIGSGLHRADLSRAVCDALGWRRPDGRRKDMSCRVAMLRMQRDGLIDLPPPRTSNHNGRIRPRLSSRTDPGLPVDARAEELGQLHFEVVEKRSESSLWNELIQRYHYLGYKPLPGAQMRYLVTGGGQLLAIMGFGASAWKVAPRDHWIGWTVEQRRAYLHLVVNNARFLILPWINSPNLASRILSEAAKRIPLDWRDRYGYAPVLLETFVQGDRFRGTCYRAANWVHVGQTQGRGKLDRYRRNVLPVKDVFLYPLRRDFRRHLC
jgi:hypothetical protein